MFIRIILGSGLCFVVMLYHGCNGSQERKGDQPPSTRTNDNKYTQSNKIEFRDSQRELIRGYIGDMSRRYDLNNKYGISMTLAEKGEEYTIVVTGEVEDEDTLYVIKQFFSSPYANPDLPAPLVWEVAVKQCDTGHE